MKYSKKATVIPLVIFAACSSLGAYVAVNNERYKPTKPPVEPSSIITPPTSSPTKAFAGIEGMKVVYPSLWSATPASSNITNKNQLSVDFKAPNTMIKTRSEGDEEVMTGAKITLFKNNFAKTKSLEEYKKSDSFIWKYAENKKDSVVKGIPVTEFDVSYEGDSQHYAVFYKDSHEYILVMNGESHRKEEYKTVFENLIKNMEFKKSP